MSVIEVQLARGVLQRRGRLVVGETTVELHRPGWPAPWTFPIDEVTLIDPDVTPSSDGAGIEPPQDDPMASPVVFPRMEVVRIHQEREPNLLLVPHRPVQVPGTRRPRWCDIVGVAVKTWPSEEQLRGSRLRRVPSVEEALVTAYGTVGRPALSEHEMQTGWEVDGLVLTRPGPYSADPRPIARAAVPAAGDATRPQENPVRWLAAGTTAAVCGSLVWMAVAQWAADGLRFCSFLLAILVGGAIRTVRMRTTSLPHGRAGVAAAVLTAGALTAAMVGTAVIDWASIEHLTLRGAAADYGEKIGWSHVLAFWYQSGWDYANTAFILVCAFGVGANGADGVARRVRAAV